MRYCYLVPILMLGAGLACAADIESMKADGLAALNEQRFDEAVSLYSKVLETEAGDAEASYRLGTALLALERNAAAIDAFKAAAAGGFQTAGAQVRLAQLHARDGRPQEALEFLQQAADAGFGTPGLIDSIPAFDSMRTSEPFQAIYKTIRGTRYPCEVDPNAHAFDFWIGEWDVYVGGQLAGTNSIKPILNHCALSEEWSSASGGKGRSYNYFDTGTRTWNQVWISDSGSFVEFEGEARDGGIFYTAETINPANGSVTLHKFFFTVFDNGDVRQAWETSTDDGATWTNIWDSRYVRQSVNDAPGG